MVGKPADNGRVGLQHVETTTGPVAVGGRTINLVARTTRDHASARDPGTCSRTWSRPVHVEILDADGRREIVKVRDYQRLAMTAIAGAAARVPARRARRRERDDERRVRGRNRNARSDATRRDRCKASSTRPPRRVFTEPTAVGTDFVMTAATFGRLGDRPPSRRRRGRSDRAGPDGVHVRSHARRRQVGIAALAAAVALWSATRRA